MTSDQILSKLQDKMWRMRNLYLILPEDSNEPTPLQLRDEQVQYLTQGHNRLFIPKARKLGISTIIVLDFLDECIFNKNTFCGHLDLREADCAKKLEIALFAWKNGCKHPDAAIAALWQGIHMKIKLVGESKSTLEWSNGSKQMASQSFTGTTPAKLHLSEFAVLADQDVGRANRIIQGSLNAVPLNGFVVIESTMRAPSGPAYDLFKLALSKVGQTLSPLDWNFLFFPWFKHPKYQTNVIDDISESTRRYSEDLRAKHSIQLTEQQLAWYDYKSKEQGRFMTNEFPSVPEECVMVQSVGAIYPEITDIRAKGRVTSLEIDKAYPVYVAADLGISDKTALWIIQFSGRDILVHDFWSSSHVGAAQTAQQIIKWEQQFNVTFLKVLLPHDANKRDHGSAKTYISQLNEAGIAFNKCLIVPRTSDVWLGINWWRDNFNRTYFDKRCDKAMINPIGKEEMSGLACLSNYRTKPNDPYTPYHGTDGASDGADAFRCFSQAVLNNLIHCKDSVSYDHIRKFRPTQQKGDFVMI